MKVSNNFFVRVSAAHHTTAAVLLSRRVEVVVDSHWHPLMATISVQIAWQARLVVLVKIVVN